MVVTHSEVALVTPVGAPGVLHNVVALTALSCSGACNPSHNKDSMVLGIAVDHVVARVVPYASAHKIFLVGGHVHGCEERAKFEFCLDVSSLSTSASIFTLIYYAVPSEVISN